MTEKQSVTEKRSGSGRAPVTERLPWILDSGLCPETAAAAKVSAFLRPDGKDALLDAFLLAFYADRFWAARGECIPPSLPDVENLLEVRVCRTDAELWMHRSRLGAAFAWRVADDAALWNHTEQNADLFSPDDYRFETVQLLDIARRGGKDEYGCMEVRSTTGGRYALPVADGDDRVKIVNYISYNADGVAGIADFRVAGFASPERGRGENAD